MPHVLGSSSPASSTWPAYLANTELFVWFGHNPLTTTEIAGGGDGNHFDFYWFNKIKESGIPIVSINPIQEETDQYFNTEHIAIRPNTDTALMLALAHVIYSEGLHDQDFLDKYTVGFDRFVEYLTGKTDGQPKTPEWAAPITDVSADTIRNLAHRMAQNRTAIVGGYSMQRAQHGAQPVWMEVVLSSMLGYFGKPGGGITFRRQQGAPSGSAPSVPRFAGLANPVKDFVPVNMWADLFLNPGKTIDYNGQNITYPDIKLVAWAGGNPFHHAQDINRVVKAWQHPEVAIVADYNWTATAKHADIVLPATTTMERNDLTRSSHYILAMKKIVDPLFEARSDFDMFAEVADKLGLKDQFTEGRDEMGWLREMYGVAQQQAQASGLDMPDFDTFWDREYLFFDEPEDAQNVVAYSDFIENPALNPLGTPSGKIEIYSETIASFNYDDSPPHPMWIEPSEWLGSPQTDKYPLHVVTHHPKYRLHSQLDNAFIHDWYEVRQREPMWINPQDAADRGLESGDVARVFNERGQMLVGVVVTDQARPGVIAVCEGGWYDPVEPGVAGTLDNHGNVNMVTTDAPDSKLADGNPSNTSLAQVEKYTGPLPYVRAFTPPEERA
jgi:trimethylamine-N-oxide reductase (cytochrome c)